MVEIVDQITFLKDIEKALKNPNNKFMVLYALRTRIAELESEMTEFEKSEESEND